MGCWIAIKLEVGMWDALGGDKGANFESWLPHIICLSAGDGQPNQPDGPPTDVDHAPSPHAVELHRAWHSSLDRDVAKDADRRASRVATHLVGQLVRSRRYQDPIHPTLDRCQELVHGAH
eukprot:1608097-Prymnesium_polylepis.2